MMRFSPKRLVLKEICPKKNPFRVLFHTSHSEYMPREYRGFPVGTADLPGQGAGKKDLLTHACFFRPAQKLLHQTAKGLYISAKRDRSGTPYITVIPEPPAYKRATRTRIPIKQNHEQPFFFSGCREDTFDPGAGTLRELNGACEPLSSISLMLRRTSLE